MSRGWRVRVAGLALLTALAGCTSTVEGAASPADDATPSAPPTTSAPTTTAPTQPPIEITPPPERGVGLLLEAHRIASVTALVQASFPDRTDSCFPAGPATSPAQLEARYFASDTVAPILTNYGFVTAWGQCHQTTDAEFGTITLAMELSDPQAAIRAANELVASQAIGGFQVVPVDTDGGALLLQEGDRATVQAFIPVGRMVAYIWHESLAAAAGDDITRVLGDQATLLEGFSPTPQADVPDLPTDPDGLHAMALDPPGDFNDYSGPYDFEGYLRIAIDPVQERELLGGNGFSGFYAKQSDDGETSYAVALYRFGTIDQTNAVYEGFRELEATAYGGTPFVLPAIPQAPCYVFDLGGGFYQRCYVGFRTFLASVDVGGLSTPDDYGRMNELLPAQRDLIDD